MIDKYLNRFVLTTNGYGKLKILRPVPMEGDPWGVLAPLKGTAWGEYIPVIDGQVFSEAMYGYAVPLMQVIGYDPIDNARRFAKKNPSLCKNMGDCPMANEATCFPCKKIPDCYEAPGFEEYPEQQAATLVAKAWGEGRYVLVVEGGEFSLWKGKS